MYMYHVALLTSPTLSVWVDLAVWLLLHVCVFVIVASHFKGMKHEHC